MNQGNGNHGHGGGAKNGGESLQAFSFRLNGQTVRVEGVSPNVTLLDFLRGRGCKGTKEGCAEGDCGACSVAVVERDAAGVPRHRAINSCLALLPMVAGREVVTVEGVAGEAGKIQDPRSKIQGRSRIQDSRPEGEAEAALVEGAGAGNNGTNGHHETTAAGEVDPLEKLHPVQRAMVERYGSQCGYCTPGFVVSMFEAYGREDLTERWQVSDALCGNLCRCTGYRPIAEAACAALAEKVRRQNAECRSQRAEGMNHEGHGGHEGGSGREEVGSGMVPALHYRKGEERFLQPGSLEELLALRARWPEATLIAGATELGLEVNKKFYRFGTLISLGGVEELGRVERVTGWMGEDAAREGKGAGGWGGAYRRSEGPSDSLHSLQDDKVFEGDVVRGPKGPSAALVPRSAQDDSGFEQVIDPAQDDATVEYGVAHRLAPTLPVDPVPSPGQDARRGGRDAHPTRESEAGPTPGTGTGGPSPQDDRGLGTTVVHRPRGESGGWRFGAAASLTKVEEALRADGMDSPMGEANAALLKMIRVFGARPIRNRATLGGNLVNASPIGDMAPVLMALGASVRLRSVRGERVVALDEFFTAYRKTVLQPDEVLCEVLVPGGGDAGILTQRREEAKAGEEVEKGTDGRREAKRGEGRVLVDSFKVSRRREMDISVVSAGFFVRLDAEEVVTEARLAFGGVAATTVRARRAEAVLAGRTWGRETVEAVKSVLAEELTPINDVRASAEYRRGLVRDLFEKFFALDGAEELPLDRRALVPPAALPEVRTLAHESAVGHVTGAARYVDDARPPQGLLETWPVCAPHARARIVRRDASAARGMPGVRAVLLAEDVPGENDVGAVRKDEILLADKEVFFHGQIVALVVGETLEACRLAAAEVVVEYEVMEAVLSVRDAIAKESFHTSPHRIARGDVEAVLGKAEGRRQKAEVSGRRAEGGENQAKCNFAEQEHSQVQLGNEGNQAATPQNGTNAARRSPSTSEADTQTTCTFKLEGEFLFGGQEHFYLEGQVAWAEPGDDGSMFIQSSTQHPSEIQAVVAHVLHVPKHRVVVQSPRMGGGFGGKETQGNTWAALAALAAHCTGSPVRVRLNRDQDMILTGKRHPFLARYEVGFTEEGVLRAVRVELFADAGWSLDLSTAITDRALFHLDNAYYLPNVDFSGRAVKTNLASNTAFRGFGGPQGMLVIEEIVDQVARELGLPPEVVRERNFYHGSGETNTTHYGQPIGDNRLLRVWSELKASSEFEGRKREIAEWNAGQARVKRGLAMTPVKFGISFTLSHLNQAGAHVLIYQDGSVQVNHGGTEMGQGLYTKMLAVAARELGLPTAQIRVMQTRTDQVPNTSPTAASSGSDLNGQAVRAACVTLRERLAPVAADLLGEPMEEAATLVFKNGFVFHPAREGRKLPFGEVTMKAYLARVSLAATGYYATPGIKYDHGSGRGTPFFYFVCGAAVAEVEVDGYTGAHQVRRVDILHDVGRSINPGVDRGQIEGAFTQGMGWLTCEELRWDKEGRLLTHAPSTYKIPAFGDAPVDWRVGLLADAAEEKVIHGSKAVGEPPLMLAISVREAIREAVGAFGVGGRVELPSPATGEAIYLSVQRERRGAERLVEVEAKMGLTTEDTEDTETREEEEREERGVVGV